MESREPQSLRDAIIYFSDPKNCLNYMTAKRWPKGVTCPECGSQKLSFLEKHNRWQCSSHHAKRQFTIKTGTIFEDSPLGLDKWLPVVWLIVNCKNGVSSYEIARDLKVTQKTAWFMLHRIRLALQDRSNTKIGGLGQEVEVDETYIGGKARNMHLEKRKRILEGKGGGSVGKTGVQGMLERDGRVRLNVIPDAKQATLVPNVRESVEPGTHLYTDEAVSYFGMQAEYVHEFISHAEGYVNGRIHTNGLENFWSLLKRGLGGTYISIEPFHLFRYLDEQAFRYNTRKDMGDGDRFGLAVSQIVGRRLTHAELTGKLGGATPN